MVDASLDVAYALLNKEKEEEDRLAALRVECDAIDAANKKGGARVAGLKKAAAAHAASAAKKRKEVADALGLFATAKAEDERARAQAAELGDKCKQLRELIAEAASAKGDAAAPEGGVQAAVRAAADARALARDYKYKVRRVDKEEAEAKAAAAAAEAAKAAAGESDGQVAKTLSGLADDIEEKKQQLAEALKSICACLSCAPTECARERGRARARARARARPRARNVRTLGRLGAAPRNAARLAHARPSATTSR